MGAVSVRLVNWEYAFSRPWRDRDDWSTIDREGSRCAPISHLERKNTLNSMFSFQVLHVPSPRRNEGEDPLSEKNINGYFYVVQILLCKKISDNGFTNVQRVGIANMKMVIYEVGQLSVHTPGKETLCEFKLNILLVFNIL